VADDAATVVTVGHRENLVSVKNVLKRAAGFVSAERVYGAAVTVDGVTVIPAAVVRGGGGGGGGTDGEQGGEGGGFGVDARPVGAFVIDADGVRWKPVVDVGRIVLGFQVLAIVWMWLRWRSARSLNTDD